MKRSPMPRRRTPLRTRKGLARTGPLARKTRLAPVNPERLAKRREEEFAKASGYHRWVMEQPCAACGSYHPDYGSQPAHVGKTRGAGAKADHALSLCDDCHRYEGEHRNEFNAAFAERHGVLPVEMARYRYVLYHREREV